jgi:hypothetical protein
MDKKFQDPIHCNSDAAFCLNLQERNYYTLQDIWFHLKIRTIYDCIHFNSLARLQYLLFARVIKYHIIHRNKEFLFQLIPRYLDALKSMYNFISEKGKCTKTIFDLVKKRHD